MSVQARSYLRSMQIHPALDVSSMDLSDFELHTREDVEQLGAEAIAEADANGGIPGRAHMAWQRALQLGLDERLPSLNDANGAIAQTVEQQQAKANAARANSAQFLMSERLPAELRDMHLDGVPISEIPVEILHDQMALYMADATPGPARDAASKVMALIDSAPATSFTGIQWEAPDQRLEYTVNSQADADANDAYAQGQRMLFNQEHGSNALDSLAIRAHRYGNDNLMAGITSLNPDGGGTLETYFDPFSQAMAGQGGDYHQGDDGNTFEMEE